MRRVWQASTSVQRALHATNAGDQRAEMARVILMSWKNRNAISAPLHRFVRQVFSGVSSDVASLRPGQFGWSPCFSSKHWMFQRHCCSAAFSTVSIFDSEYRRKIESSKTASDGVISIVATSGFRSTSEFVDDRSNVAHDLIRSRAASESP